MGAEMSVQRQHSGPVNTHIMQPQQPSYLCNLAPELKVEIFRNLSSIDDYRRMGATNKDMEALVKKNHVSVLRGIIVSISQAE